MNEFKYQITQIVFLVLLGIGAYWAFTHLDNGVTYSRNEIVSTATTTVTETPDETVDVIDTDAIALPSDRTLPVTESETTETPSSTESSTTTSSGNHSELIDELQKIVDADIIMKNGSSGTRVGSVQKFLDVYFDDRDVSADNDFGPGTTRLVKEFQTAELNGGDGRVGPNTLKSMITWLENN